MKKLLIWAMVLSSIMLGACTSEDGSKNDPGSIYGIVTELGTAEPMKAIGVELYKAGALLLKTVTFDDGHFEFSDLNAGNYQVKVVADGYEQTEEGNVTVEAGRQARIDLQVRKQVFKNHMVVRTIEATTSSSQATLKGEYLYDATEYAPSEVGFVYATQNNPKEGGTLVKGKVNNETKSFSVSIDGLSKGTYFVQAYAKNKVGTEYGEVRSFIISLVPAVTTLDPTNVLAETATLNGRIDAEGDPAYTERGFVYSKSFNRPTVDDLADITIKVPVSGRSKDFSANVSSLIENSTYYVRAYATYEGGTVYGEVIEFTPAPALPVVVTLEASNILQTSATLNGRIDNAGEPAYIERGFVYSASYKIPAIGDPTTATTKVIVDGTNKEFRANVSSLRDVTTYYVRAYATSSCGTSYGGVLEFTSCHPNCVIIGKLMVQKEDLGKADWRTAYNMCADSRVGGYQDWRLPTLDELRILYTHKDEIGGFKEEWDANCADYYWGASAYPSDTSQPYLMFTTGEDDTAYRTNKFSVRAVRTIE